MNEQNPAMTPVEAGSVPDYKERSIGLVVFGVLTILLGCLCGLLVPLMLFGQTMAAKAPDAPPVNVASILPGLAVYAMMAVALIWLGIGSIQARRWARALLLIFSWSWLIMGIVLTVIMPFVMSRTFANLPTDAKTGQPAMPAAVATGMVIGMTLFFAVTFILLPAVWTFFYQSRHVKATCEARDRVRRWTDACPLPVLGFCIWIWLAVPMMLIMPVAINGVMPFFGKFISGLPGTMMCLAIAAIWGVAGWWLYRLEMRGWWLILVAMLLFMVSTLLTYAHHDVAEMYQLMGYPQTQIDQVQKIGLFPSNHMGSFTALCSLPFLGYLLLIKKYLRKC